jgi:hypothetical protein
LLILYKQIINEIDNGNFSNVHQKTLQDYPDPADLKKQYEDLLRENEVWIKTLTTKKSEVTEKKNELFGDKEVFEKRVRFKVKTFDGAFNRNKNRKDYYLTHCKNMFVVAKSNPNNYIHIRAEEGKDKSLENTYTVYSNNEHALTKSDKGLNREQWERAKQEMKEIDGFADEEFLVFDNEADFVSYQEEWNLLNTYAKKKEPEKEPTEKKEPEKESAVEKEPERQSVAKDIREEDITGENIWAVYDSYDARDYYEMDPNTLTTQQAHEFATKAQAQVAEKMPAAEAEIEPPDLAPER